MDGGCIVLSSRHRKVLKKKVISCGDPHLNPVDGSKCRLAISDVMVRDAKDSGLAGDSFYLTDRFQGETVVGSETHFIDSDVDRCLLNVYRNEVSLIDITYLDGDDAEALRVSLVVHLIEIETPPVDPAVRAAAHKRAGVALVHRNKHADAFRQFGKALKLMLALNPERREKREVVKLYNNLAHCQLQHDEYAAALRLCDRVLAVDPDNIKALYRRGVAHMGLEHWEEAHADMAHVLRLDPNVAEAKAKMAVLREKVDVINRAYANTIRNMFG